MFSYAAQSAAFWSSCRYSFIDTVIVRLMFLLFRFLWRGLVGQRSLHSTSQCLQFLSRSMKILFVNSIFRMLTAWFNQEICFSTEFAIRILAKHISAMWMERNVVNVMFSFSHFGNHLFCIFQHYLIAILAVCQLPVFFKTQSVIFSVAIIF